MSTRVIKVLDAAALARRGVLVLELDTPNPILGLNAGMVVDLIFRDGGHEQVKLKGLGFASSTPDHAHLIVTAPERGDITTLDRIEVERDSISKP